MATARTASSSGSGSMISHIGNLSLDNPSSSIAAQLQGPRSLQKELSRLSRTSAHFESSGYSGGDEDDHQRRPPITVKDPQAQLLTFIQHLLSSQYADTDPHLVAIGYELEALLSIYPSSLKLSVTSRPPSLRTVSPPPSTDTRSNDIHDRIKTVSAAINKRASQSWDDAVFDASIWTPGERIRYEVVIPVWEDGEVLEGLAKQDMPREIPTMRVLVSLPPTYPDSAPPQLQLLGRYLGNFGIDAGLFGDITRTFIASNAVPFTPGDVCVFEGLTYAQGIVRKWYANRLSEGAEGEKSREEDRRRGRGGRAMGDFPTSPNRPFFDNSPSGPADHPASTSSPLATSSSTAPAAPQEEIPRRPSPRPTFSYSREAGAVGFDISRAGAQTPMSVHQAQSGVFPHFVIHVSPPVIDRKSTFIGHAIRVTDEREVPLVIHEILSDKKVAKAAHPAMFAYRISKDVGGLAGKVIQTDCDDDGETAAGSRLAHLLEILEVENVLVVVSRWYGGILLGADRFKHINQAARDALEVGGFLAAGKDGKEGKGRRK